jgi:1-hydroxycarotenoid 3,4-desaturase
LKKRHAIIIGAGIGGLVAGVELARRGFRVTVFEQGEQPGGKLRTIDVGGRAIDSGPTVFTLPWVFEEIFTSAGSRIDEHLQIRPAELLARHAWRDGSRLDLFSDIEQSAAAIADFAGASEASRYRKFCARAQRVYRTLEQPFMLAQRPSIGTLIRASGLSGLLDLWHIQPFQSLWKALGKSFQDQRLRGLFARYATYCGSSPLQAPATLMLIAHVEQSGVWQIEGGMRRLADALLALLHQHGGKIYYQSIVSKLDVSEARVGGIRLSSGERVCADVVISNSDITSTQSGRLGQQASAAVPAGSNAQRSLSAVTWSLLAECSNFELAHHNVFFPDDYPQEFVDIFEHHRLPSNPAVYVCAQDRGIPSDTRGPERLFLITNAPATGDQGRFLPSVTQSLEAATFKLLADCGLTLNSRPEHAVMTTPADFEVRFPGTGGALYGTPAHGWKSSFSRPGSRSNLPGLYFAGGSVHPGPGLPMVAISGRLAAEAAMSDLGMSAE